MSAVISGLKRGLRTMLGNKINFGAPSDPGFAVAAFRHYVRIKESMQPKTNYDVVLSFLEDYVEAHNLTLLTYKTANGASMGIVKIEGCDPNLPALCLNSHMDVVPVTGQTWTYDPFSAHMDEEGNIFGRGTQDMKICAIHHVEAVARLLREGWTPKRNIVIAFAPDEEIGGHNGWETFMKAPEFKELNIGTFIDEGLADPTAQLGLFYGERSPYWIKFIAPGNPGHGSMFVEDTAMEKVQDLINEIQKMRAENKGKIETESAKLGDVTTVNINMMQGGSQPNVVPSELSVTVDFRVTPSIENEEFEELIASLAKKCGVKFEYIQKPILSRPSSQETAIYKAITTALESRYVPSRTYPTL
eukprot:TRINITY_DN1954_c0_g1_i2.p1 TRINITY_DN1954_c0_g1~~TRINITY_DN1954_c0_g1_i2.p1  ORF type:complete len:394 (-),score=75.07 TRINITY_DN1954_c0_g1_i2:260-1339(-)